MLLLTILEVARISAGHRTCRRTHLGDILSLLYPDDDDSDDDRAEQTWDVRHPHNWQTWRWHESTPLPINRHEY
ncbi:hypothetical protein C8R46DRAFT_1120476, partial [Mycena filopes]